jgi:APA family basic amino acid/polyamine antiporter
MTAPQTSAALRRDLNLLDAVGIGLGAVMGAGIFVVTGVAAGVAGPAFLVGLVIAGLVATCNGLSSAQLAARFPQSGGTYEYAYQTLSPSAGFAAGWMFLISKLAAAGTVALGFGHYAATFLGGSQAVFFAAAAVLLVTTANLFGIKKAGKFNLAIVAVTLLSLGVFVVFGLQSFQSSNMLPFAPYGLRGIAESSALLFFAYTGYARLATLGEEVKEPEKTIPKAILITLILSFVIYLTVGVVAVGSIGAPELAASRSPLERAALTFTVPGINTLLVLGAASAMLGVLLSQILGISRMMLAMSRRGDLPGFLGRIDERRGIPLHAILITGAIALLLALFGTLESIVAAAAFTILIYYFLTNIAALRLTEEHRLYPSWIAWAGLVGCLIMAFSLKPHIMFAGLLLLATGFVFRWCLRSSS